MRIAQSLFLITSLPPFAIVLHEVTHLAVARSVSPVSVQLASYVPLRLQLDFYYTPSSFGLRVVALAPLLVGGIVAIVATQTGLWQQIRHTDPYYLSFLIGANWLLYSLPSPADFRSVLTATEESASKGGM